MLDDLIRELDLDPAHPQLDQYRAAIAEVDALAEKYGRLGATVLRLDRAPLPPPIGGWLREYAADLTGGRVRRCRHGSWFTPTTMFASTPGRAFCPRCADARGAELRAAHSGPFALDCDFCGVPTDVFALGVVVVPVVTILVRGVACARCLA